MKYFIESIITYKSTNKKGREVQEILQPLEKVLLDDEPTLDRVKDYIEYQVDQLNHTYRNSKPLVVDDYRSRGLIIWTIHIEGDREKIVARMFIDEVRVIGTTPWVEVIQSGSVETE